MSSDRLGEFKMKIKFQNLNFNTNKTDRGRLQEIQNKEFDLENMVFWKTGRWGEVAATRGSTVLWNFVTCIYWPT